MQRFTIIIYKSETELIERIIQVRAKNQAAVEKIAKRSITEDQYYDIKDYWA